MKPTTDKECRKLKRDLERLTDVILAYLDSLDRMLETATDIPRETSIRLGKFANFLDMNNDRIRYSSLGVDFRSDNKKNATAKAVARIRKS